MKCSIEFKCSRIQWTRTIIRMFMFIIFSFFFPLKREKINNVKWGLGLFFFSHLISTVNLYDSKCFVVLCFFFFFSLLLTFFHVGNIFFRFRVVQLLKSTNVIWYSLLLFTLPLCVSRAYQHPHPPYVSHPLPSPQTIQFLSVSLRKRRIINTNIEISPNTVKGLLR